MTGRNIKKGSFKKGEDAVSPVIGVILMVAITVILAAVIGAFVFGMGSGVQKTYIVAATASQVGSDIVVTYNGGPDADYVGYINVTEAGSADADEYLNGGTNETLTGNTVGTSAKYVDAGSTGKNDHVLVVATFTDGSQQIILDTYV
jgi:flagellin-like protein